MYPFWFADSGLLANFFRAELYAAARLLADHADLLVLFDAPDTTLTQRRICFELLSHRMLVQVLDGSIVARYETGPDLNDVESRTLRQTNNLVPEDAPNWAREMKLTVDQMPPRIVQALPEPLQREGYFPDNEERHTAVRSAAGLLSTVEQLQDLVKSVVDQEWRRLERRWPTPVTDKPPIIVTTSVKKRRRSRTVDKRRAYRIRMIAEIDDISRSPIEFLQLMDERGVEPQPTWAGWPGSWVKAYQDDHLRKLIQQDKSRALICARARRSK